MIAAGSPPGMADSSTETLSVEGFTFFREVWRRVETIGGVARARRLR